MQKSKFLIVYYSRSGNTRKVAQKIASILNAEIEEIIETKNRRGFLGWFSAGYDAIFKKSTTIKPLQKDITQYDTVIIGTPIWAGTVATPIKTFLENYKDQIKHAAFFCTKDDYGGKAFFEMERIYGEKPIATLQLTSWRVKLGKDEEKIKEFAGRVKNIA